MGKTGHFVHRIKKEITVEYNNAYDTNRKGLIRLNRDITDGGNNVALYKKLQYAGNIQLIRLKGTISGGATQITLKGYGDEAGTELLLPPSTGTFESGITGSNAGVVFKVDVFHAAPTDDLYLFCKTNTGTFTISEVQVAWYE